MKSILAALEKSTDHSPSLTTEVLDLLRRIGENGNGLRIRFREDFDALRRLTEDNPDRDELSPMFDPRYCDISGETGFWIEGLCPSGDIAHVQAVRFDDLGDSSLCEFWAEHKPLFRPPGVAVDLGKSQFDAAPASHMISGRTCYHGELWIREDYRGLHLASKLANLAMLLAAIRFQPDYLYCLIPPKTVRTGLSVRNGYLHLHPHGIRWSLDDDAEIYDEYLVWMNGRELGGLMERHPAVS